jgi:hypothetical protein
MGGKPKKPSSAPASWTYDSAIIHRSPKVAVVIGDARALRDEWPGEDDAGAGGTTVELASGPAVLPPLEAIAPSILVAKDEVLVVVETTTRARYAREVLARAAALPEGKVLQRVVVPVPSGLLVVALASKACLPKSRRVLERKPSTPTRLTDGVTAVPVTPGDYEVVTTTAVETLDPDFGKTMRFVRCRVRRA